MFDIAARATQHEAQSLTGSRSFWIWKVGGGGEKGTGGGVFSNGFAEKKKKKKKKGQRLHDTTYGTELLP